MKFFVAVIMLFGGLNYSYAQLEAILNVPTPTAIYNHNDTLYIGTYSNTVFRHIIHAELNLDPVYNFSSYRMANHQRRLYFSDTRRNIYRINLDDNSIDLFYDQAENAAGLAVYKDDLYYSEFYNGELRKIELFVNATESKLVLSGLDDLAAVAEHNGYLYLAELRTGNILRTDLRLDIPEVDTVFVNSFNVPNELYVLGDYMYVSEYSGNQVSRFDLTMDNPDVEVVLENITTPTGLSSDKDYLYISSHEADEVLRLPLSILSSVQEVSSKESPVVYPNPSNGQFTVSNFSGQKKYKIYDLNGQLIQSGQVRNGEQIMMKDASMNYYFMQIGNGGLVKIAIN